MPGEPSNYTDIGGGGKLPPHGEDYFNRITNVHWPKKVVGLGGCRFAVCGYDGYYAEPPVFKPVFFGVGAYSNDGRSWAPFREFANGSMVSAFHMRDPFDNNRTILTVGGCLNNEGGVSTSTASLVTLLGAGPSVSGGTADGTNVANFGSIGYNTDTHQMYAAENDSTEAPPILHTFQLGGGAVQLPTTDKPLIFWAGREVPGIESVYRCTCFGFDETDQMKFKDKNGDEHTLSIVPSETTLQLMLDGANITPPGARHVISAAGGMNDDGDVVIVATGYHDVGGWDFGIAWCSVAGGGWSQISGVWGDSNGELQGAEMACAVPNPP